MKINYKKRNGLNLVEMTMTLAIIGVVSMLVVPTLISNFNTRMDKIRLTKAHSSIKDVVDTLLNDSQYYSSSHDFGYKEENANTDEFKKKFRKRFAATFVSYTRTPCKIYNGTGLVDLNDCYLTSDIIAWGVPESDFDTVNVYRTNKNGVILKYIPVTVYPNYNANKSEQDSNYFYNNAIIYGIRKDGDLIFIDTPINKETYPDAAHYKIKEYLE